MANFIAMVPGNRGAGYAASFQIIQVDEDLCTELGKENICAAVDKRCFLLRRKRSNPNPTELHSQESTAFVLARRRRCGALAVENASTSWVRLSSFNLSKMR